MSALVMILLRRGGWARPALVAACTAVVTALLLVALSILLLPEYPEEQLLSIVAESGTRGGVAFGAAILTVPLVLLLHQALRLGNAARERRLAGLRLAGATPGEVRVLGAGEVALPALAGAVLGLGVWGLMRLLLGGTPTGRPVCLETADDVTCTFSGSGIGLGLVPTTVAPPWWGVLLLVLGVALLGLVMGLATGRTVSTTPHGVTRRSTRRRPRPWGLLVLAVASGLVVFAVVGHGNWLAELGIFAALALAVVGLVLLSPWTAYALGRLASQRVTTVPGLLAAQRLVADPRSAGRAGAAVGGIGLAAGVVAFLLGDLLVEGQAEAYYVWPIVLVGVCLVATLVVVSLTLAVHSAETLTDRRRSMASLHALGVPAEDIRSSQVWEGGLVAVPMALIGVVLGGLAPVLLGGGVLELLAGLVAAVVVPWLALVAVRLAVRITGPVAARVIDPEHLRTA